MKRQAVILAGGKGKRVEHITHGEIPKSLIEIEGSPFLSFQLSLLKFYKFEEVILCTGFKSELIEERYGSYYQDVKLIYSHDPFDNCGTATALKYAEHLFEDKFVLMYGDVFVPFPLNEMLDSVKNELCYMLVAENTDDYERSNVTLLEGYTVYSKSLILDNAKYIDTGVYICNKDILKYIAYNTKVEFHQVLEMLAQARILNSFVLGFKPYEIGSQEGIDRFAKHIREEIGCK